jgi:hypothetical protein
MQHPFHISTYKTQINVLHIHNTSKSTPSFPDSQITALQLLSTFLTSTNLICDSHHTPIQPGSQRWQLSFQLTAHNLALNNLFYNTFPLPKTQQVSAPKPQLHTIQSKHSKTYMKLKTTPCTFNLIPNTLGNFCSEMCNSTTEKEVITQYRASTFQISVNQVCKRQTASYNHSSFHLHTDIDMWEIKKELPILASHVNHSS